MTKLTKKEEILKLRAAESVLQDIVDNLTEQLEAVESALRERGEVPSNEIGEVEADEAKYV